jgi:hypothetical protein
MLARILAAATVIGSAALTVALSVGWLTIPDRWNPAAPISIDDAPNFLTSIKLARLSSHPDRCRAALATSSVRYADVPDRRTDSGCGYANAVRVASTGRASVSPFTITCESAVALALWERHVLQPAAIRQFGEPVAAIEHFGSYACRTIGRAGHGPLSEHAGANALDVAGFTLRGGMRIRVRDHWRDNGAKGRFLHEVHRGACGFFDVVLGPNHDAAHADHVHLDRGASRACR